MVKKRANGEGNIRSSFLRPAASMSRRSSTWA